MIYHIWCEGFKFSLDECARAQYIGLAEETLSDWDCRLFPTEEEARKSFG